MASMTTRKYVPTKTSVPPRGNASRLGRMRWIGHCSTKRRCGSYSDHTCTSATSRNIGDGTPIFVTFHVPCLEVGRWSCLALCRYNLSL